VDDISVIGRSGEQRKKRRVREKCFNSVLAVNLVDSEHGNESTEVAFTVRRLFADHNPNGMRDTLCVCLGE
jgi:hypothetical protein